MRVMALRKSAHSIRKHVHPRLQLQFVIFIIIAIIMFGIVSYDVVSQGVSLWLVVIGAVVGAAIGYGVAWAFKIQWHDDSKRVVQNTDRFSFILIGLYIVLRVGAQQELGKYVHGQMLAALLYSLIAGLMVGRVVALSSRVSKVLQKKKII